MPNPYDKILKEIVEDIFVPMAQRMLGIEARKTEELPDDLQHMIERKPDFLKKICMEGWGPDYVLHLEFQSSNDPAMTCRMLEYYALLYRKYRLPIVQCVFFLGADPMRMYNSLEHERLLYSYSIKDFRDLSATELLKSDTPEEIILAILADFDSLPPEMIIQQIITRLRSISGESLQLDQRVKQLEVLSQLRNLQTQITQILSAMPFTYDLEKDIRFQQGIAQGVAEGVEKGSEAVLRTTIERMLRSLQYRQGILTLENIADFTGTNLEYVQEIRESLDV